MFRKERNRGQSTLEYVIIITAIVGAILVGAVVLGTKSDTAGLGKLLKGAKTIIDSGTDKIGNINP